MYDIKNNSDLKIGDNKVTIEVVAQNGDKKIYTILVNREKVLSSDTGIKVIINDEEVIFNGDSAKVYVSSDEKKLKIDYVLSDGSSKVSMNEIEELKIGDNELKISVIAEDGTKKEYEIIIHRYTKIEEIISLILSLAIIIGFGYGIYYLVKKFILKNKLIRNN